MGSRLGYQNNTFIDNVKCVWWYWIAVFSREEWKAMKWIHTNCFLHFYEFSKDASNWPNINWFTISLLQEDDFRCSIPSCCNSKRQFSKWIMQWFHSFYLRSMGNSWFTYWLFYFHFFCIWTSQSFLLCLWALFRCLLFLSLLEIWIGITFCILNMFFFLLFITFFLFLWSVDLFDDPGKSKITNFDN